MRARLREIAEATTLDPKEALLNSVGDTSGMEVCHNLLLVATYVRPEITKGGVILPNQSRDEDRFQSKVGLVLKTGPLCFKDDTGVRFGGIKIEPGDWVLYRAADGFEAFFVSGNGKTPCRLLEDIHIKARVADPALLW